MKIVIATPILYETSSPFNHLFKDIIEGFLKVGHEIIRIVACEHEKEDGYKLGIEHDNIRYIPIIRKKSDRRNIIQRYISDVSITVKMAKIIKKIKADVLFEDVCYSSFWTVRAAKSKGMKVVSMLQDVWPDNAVQSGLIKEKSLLYKYFEIWQQAVYKKSDKMICISDDMKEFIKSKGISEKKINVIYNWGYSDETVDIPWSENLFVKKYNLSHDKFYAIYAGNIGRMQNVELVIRAAEKLDSNTNIQFLIIGDGVYKENIEKEVKEKNLSNVTMLPLQDSKLATSIYSAAGVNIIPLVSGGIKTALPSKTGVCLACGRPVIFCFDKQSAFDKICEKYESGSCVSSTDENELANAIFSYSKEIIKKNHGAFYMYKDLFVRTDNIKKYVDVLEKI